MIRKNILKLLPEIIVTMIFLCLMIGVHWNKPHSEDSIIQSDGRGYYAFLPAVFLQQDLSFMSTVKVEGTEGHYLIKTKEGKTINKYYPGVAVLQLPFFAAAYIFSPDKSAVTGYETLFYTFFHFGSLVYGILGFYFLRKYLSLTSVSPKSALAASFVIFFGTMVFYQIVFAPSLSHHYSFFLFALFAYLVKKYQHSPSLKKAFLAGLTLGLIFLVRPVNILIILSVPFIIGNKEDNILFFKSLFKFKNNHLLALSLFFILSLIPLLALSYAETGKLYNWSYQGEGFNFFAPKLWEILVGFRTGFFIHTPIALLALAGVLLLLKKDRFVGFSWLVYFLIVSFVTASWWSWDFGGYFGNRTYIEHLVLFAYPLAFLLDQKKYRWVTYPLAILLSLFLLSRAYQYYNHILPGRFTPTTYFQSIGALNSSNVGNFEFSREVKPYGKIGRKWELSTNTTLPFVFDSTKQFGFGAEFNFPKDKEGKCYYFTLNVLKKLDATSDFKGVALVIDLYDTISGARNYSAYPLYDYYLEAKGTSMNFKIEQAYCDYGWRTYNKASLYIYNSQLKRFSIEEFHLQVEEFI